MAKDVCSGAIYWGVPAGCFNMAMWSLSANPKSISLMFSPLRVTMIFSGFKSLCTVPIEWMYSTAFRNSTVIWNLFVRHFGSFNHSFSCIPSTYSITMHIPNPSTSSIPVACTIWGDCRCIKISNSFRSICWYAVCPASSSFIAFSIHQRPYRLARAKIW